MKTTKQSCKTTYGLTAQERFVMESATQGGGTPYCHGGQVLQRGADGNTRFVEAEILQSLERKGLLVRNGNIWMATLAFNDNVVRSRPTINWRGVAAVVKRSEWIANQTAARSERRERRAKRAQGK